MAQHALVRRWHGVFGAVIAVSGAVRDRFVEAGVAVDDVIPAPVELRNLRPPLGGPPSILFAGRLVHEKGGDVLLRAVARLQSQLPGVRLTIVGDGPARGELEILRHRLGLDDVVDFRPHVDRAALESAADTAWVQVVPSVWAEPFGLAAAEAMMRGTAVVASNSGGLPDVIGDHDAVALTPPRDDAALADALFTLLCDREHCERTGAAARRSALERFSPSRVAEQFLGHYARLGVPSLVA
jgi:glycosyltransferase involved in cell wall biosynthesis